MPANIVVINDGWREYYVGDSKLEELLAWLREKGSLLKEEAESQEHYKGVLKEFYEDADKATVLNEFFKRIFERGEMTKVFFTTTHGSVKVIKESK